MDFIDVHFTALMCFAYASLVAYLLQQTLRATVEVQTSGH